MIFRHRINRIFEDEDYSSVMGFEMDFRTQKNKLVVQHDLTDCRYQSFLFSSHIRRTNIMMAPNVKIIANIKESGIEEEIINIFNFYKKDYYLLDSQIPDMIKISKKFPEMKHRFILRVSDYETLNMNIFNFIKPKYIWVDWHNFDEFDEKEYLKNINNIIKTLNDIGAEPIIVSPELYNLDYIKYLNLIKDKIEGAYSVCTKYHSEWENYAKPD